MFADFYGFLYYLIQHFSYPGIFLASFIASATIFLPISSHLLTFVAAGFLNPWLVGLVSALGATLGECVGYALGYGIKKVVDGRKIFKEQKWVGKLKRWMFLLIFISAATPLPDDLAGMYAGAISYPFAKFFLACFLGKVVLFVLIAMGGYSTFSYLF